MIASAFLNGLSKALHINARYDESWELASRAYAEAERAALDFALPHILATRTHAAIGCHLVREARELLEALEVAAASDAHLGGNMAILHAHLNLSNRDPRRARKALLAAPAAPDKGTQGEIYAYLALAMAVDGEVGGAREFAGRALETTDTVETRVAVALVDATCALGSPDQETTLQHALELVERTGIRDPLVLAMRANPTLPKGTPRPCCPPARDAPERQRIASPMGSAVWRPTRTRSTDRSRARDLGTRGRWPREPRDSHSAVHQSANGQDASATRLRETRCSQPSRGRCARRTSRSGRDRVDRGLGLGDPILNSEVKLW